MTGATTTTRWRVEYLDLRRHFRRGWQVWATATATDEAAARAVLAECRAASPGLGWRAVRTTSIVRVEDW